MNSVELRSPIKAPPLRLPGQSLQAEIEALISEGVIPYFVAAMLLVFAAALEWIGALRHAPRQPWLYTVMAALAGAGFAWRLVRVRARVRLLKLGRDGELAVGQFLEGLRVSGARVFHNIPGGDFNLDHVVPKRTADARCGRWNTTDSSVWTEASEVGLRQRSSTIGWNWAFRCYSEERRDEEWRLRNQVARKIRV